MARKIWTFRPDADRQTELWSGRAFEEQVALCSFRTISSILLQMLPGDGVILEAGCGPGTWVAYLREKGYRAVGVDDYGPALKAAKDYDKSFLLVQGDVAQLPFAPNSLAAYISLGVIEHFMEGPQQVLMEAYRALKPGGLIFMTVPVNNPFRRLVVNNLRDAYFFLLRLAGKPTYFMEWRYSNAEVRSFLEGCGFEVVLEAIDDIEMPGRNMGLWVDLPPLRHRSGAPYMLNLPGRTLHRALTLFSKSMTACGTLVVGRKPAAE